MPFAARDFPGYECKRNHNGKSFKNLHSQRQATGAMRSWAYHMALGAPAAPAPLPVQPPAAAPRARGGADPGDADPTSSRASAAGLSCDVCGREFACALGLRTHKRQVHELKKYGDDRKGAKAEKARHVCDTCGRGFKDAEALQQHAAAAHRGEQAAPRARGARGPSLRAGAEQAPPEDLVPCEVCGMMLPRGQPLAAHLEALRPVVALDIRAVLDVT